jgi:hypothetical protein
MKAATLSPSRRLDTSVSSLSSKMPNKSVRLPNNHNDHDSKRGSKG